MSVPEHFEDQGVHYVCQSGGERNLALHVFLNRSVFPYPTLTAWLLPFHLLAHP